MAGFIPQLAIDDVLSRTDLVQLIDGYLPLKKKGVNYLACCPFHHEKTPSFNVIPKKQFYYCFGCGASGNAISFLMQHQHMGFVEALELLASRVGYVLPAKDDVASAAQALKSTQSANAYQLLNQVNDYYQQALKRAPSEVGIYLKTRGVSDEVMQLFGLGYAEEGWHTLEQNFRQHRTWLIETGMLIQKDDGKTFDRYRHRLMFPIHDRQGRVVGFGGRALQGQQQPKYMNSPETPYFHKSKELYGLHQLLQHSQYQGPIVVVEGYMDVIALVQHGIFYTVATLGTATTSQHLQLLAKHTHEVIFCFDGDKAGQQAAWRALENSVGAMDGHLAMKFMFLPEGDDPDSFIRQHGPAAFTEAMAQALPWEVFWIRTLTQACALHTFAGRSQLIQKALPYLRQMPDSAFRSLLLDELAKMARMDSARILTLLHGNQQEIARIKSIKIARTPIRLALALLLQYPERLAPRLKEVVWPADHEPGSDVLAALVQQLQAQPKASTAMLIEPWRETEWFEPMQKLIAWDVQISEPAIEQEFSQLIAFIQKQSVEKQIQELMARSRQTELTLDERAHLQRLLKQRHHILS